MSMKFLGKQENTEIVYSLLEQNESYSHKLHGDNTDNTDEELLTPIPRNRSQMISFDVSVF